MLSRENIPWPVLPGKRNKELSFSISSRLNLEISGARTTSEALQAQAQSSAHVKKWSQCHSASGATARKSHHSLLYSVPAKPLILPCSSWRRGVIVSLDCNFYCFQDQQSLSESVPILQWKASDGALSTRARAVSHTFLLIRWLCYGTKRLGQLPQIHRQVVRFPSTFRPTYL